MRTHSARFAETVAGSHRAVARARLCTIPQFGADPDGVDVPILAGTVTLSASADVRAQLQLTIPGDYWDEVDPYGAEFFVERGVAFGDGTEEYVALGYFPIEDPEQASAPRGPVTLDCDDRTARAITACRVIYPWQIPAGTTHRQVLERLINGTLVVGDTDESGTYGMYKAQGGPDVPIIWTGAGYDPDAAFVTGDVVVDDSGWEFLSKLVGTRGAIPRFRATGELEVVASAPTETAPYVYALRQGRTGTLTRWSRKKSSRGVPNIVRAVGSDPAFHTGHRLAYLTDPASPLRWDGPIGPRTRYYASPLLTTSDEADAAAETILARTTGIPEETTLWMVPTPVLEPLDVVNAPGGAGFRNHVLDEVVVPLVGGGEVELRTRTVNALVETETDPEPEPDPGPGPDPDPGGNPGPTPGGGSAEDGVQAAKLLGWGPVIAGDEFIGNTINTSVWGLYNGPGHSGNGRRSSSAFSQHDGMLTITGGNDDVSGGCVYRRAEYGYRIECRVRAYADGSSPGRTDEYHPVLILWPANDEWPEGAEYDYLECDIGDTRGAGFMHLPNHTPYRQDHYRFDVDITKWFNMACEWNPRARTLKAWCNGVQVYDGKGRVAEAPGPMRPTFQLDHFGGKPRRAKFDMRFMRIYTRPNT